jgi:hypothetical protein
MSDRLNAIRERINRGNCTGDEKWLLAQVERLSRIEAAAVAYRDAVGKLKMKRRVTYGVAVAEDSLFATLPSNEAVPHD